MYKQFYLIVMGLVALQLALSSYAEPAPVFDVDTVQGQYDSSYDHEQDLPPPPPPGNDSLFVPSRSSTSDAYHAEDSADSMPYEQRIRRIEQQINYLKSNTGAARVESLQAEIQVMRGQLEVLTRQLEKMEGQQKTLYADLDKRVSLLKSAGVDAVAPTAPVSAKASKKAKAEPEAKTRGSKQPNVEEEQEIYQTAYTLIKEKKYSEAVNALHHMLEKYPSGQFASNAHYWLGELYGLMNQNDKAMSEFTKVVNHYPDSPRVSDAQLKIGLILASDSKWSEAKAAFKKVINRYPGTASARLASEQLKDISAAGH